MRRPMMVHSAVFYIVQTSANPCSTVLIQTKAIETWSWKFSTFYGNNEFINVFTIVRHWALSWARWLHSTRKGVMFDWGFVVYPYQHF